MHHPAAHGKAAAGIWLGLTLFLPLVPSAPAAGQEAGVAADVRAAVVQYMEAIDAGDLDRQMRFWSHDATATSAIMGELWTGHGSIRAHSAEYVPVSKVMRNELGQVSVVSLGDDTALAVAPYRPVRRNAADEKLKPFELDSLLTLVFRRTSGRWAIVHEHVSVKVPPPVAK